MERVSGGCRPGTAAAMVRGATRSPLRYPPDPAHEPTAWVRPSNCSDSVGFQGVIREAVGATGAYRPPIMILPKNKVLFFLKRFGMKKILRSVL